MPLRLALVLMHRAVQVSRRSRLGAPLATLLRSAPWVEPALERCAIAQPMRLEPARLRERGFNQALELARRLAPQQPAATLLPRTRETPAQSGLTRT